MEKKGVSMENTTIKQNEKDYENGITLKVSVQFIDNGNGTMSVLSFNIDNTPEGGYKSIDYSNVIKSKTLADILEEFKSVD